MGHVTDLTLLLLVSLFSDRLLDSSTMGSDHSTLHPWARIQSSEAMAYLGVDGVISRGERWMGGNGLSHPSPKHAEMGTKLPAICQCSSDPQI